MRKAPWSLLLLILFQCCGSTEDTLRLEGVVLLQRPNTALSHVNVYDHISQQASLPRHAATETDLSLVEFLNELRPDLEHGSSSVLVTGSWSRWTRHSTPLRRPHGVQEFLASVVFFDWCLFACACMVFLILHMLVLGRLAQNGYHLSVLIIWLCVGFSYNAIIWGRFGSNAGVTWFAGYLLEFIFLVENIFIFHIVIEAFKTPANLTRKALHVVVVGQILFEMVFFMGLAHWLRSFRVLPYVLGLWLMCCGVLAALGQPTLEVNLMETRACRAITSCLGDRLSSSYEKDGECLLRDSSGKMQVSLLGLVIFSLLLVDFLLEIDVVLTKIEEISNPYIAFTSSAVAAFSIPELFFVCKGLLQHFTMLKYGIGLVLALFGVQMLFASIYVVRPIVACGIVISIIGLCLVASTISNLLHSSEGTAGAHLSQVGQTSSDPCHQADLNEKAHTGKAASLNEE